MKPEMETLETLNTSTRLISPLLPKSVSGHRKMNPARSNSRSGRENTPPMDPNVQIDRPISPSVPKKALARATTRKSLRSDAPEDGSGDSTDSSVKIVVRIRPVNGHEREHDRIVRKVSSDSLSVGDRSFRFDSVIGSESTQEDVFELIGVPLVKNSLAGFNTSILSYGQTGSGKTYTMWGPQSAMVDGQSLSNYQGIVPRIFRMLFSEIDKKQENSEENQINYQCRCSFLEIYNEQIDDLLDPTQRNLQIRDDARNGFYVESLTEEYVTTVEDVTQILVKGLSNRKVGTTSINSKSSRSHIVFNCVIESWCKGTASKCFSNSKTSRISLIDLAGSDKVDGVGRRVIKEGRHIKQSLAKLGKVVNLLAEGDHSGKNQTIPYMDSCLTHLLRETLGGNAKVTFICAISPDERYKAETLSTLRLGQRAKNIQNKAVINEITEDDVNGLSDQIRQLKEELIREKSYGGNSVGSAGKYFKGHNARDSLNLLRVSLNRSLILPHIHNDSEEEEVDVHEDDISELCVQLSNIHSSIEESSKSILENKKSVCLPSEESSNTNRDNGTQSLNATSCQEEIELKEVHLKISESELPNDDSDVSMNSHLVCQEVSKTVKDDQLQDSFRNSNLSIIPCRQLPVLHDPTLSVSPKIVANLKKNIITSSGLSADSKHASEIPKIHSNNDSFRRSDHIRSSLQSSKVSPTESLAASLHRGLQIIDYHQQNSASRRSLVGLSLEHLAVKSCQPVDNVDASVQTLLEEGGSATPFLCSNCKNVDVSGCKLASDIPNMQLVPTNEAGVPEMLKKQVLKDEDKTSTQAIKREIDLQTLCDEQAAIIKQLNGLVDHYKFAHEQNSVIKQKQDAEVLCLEGSSDGVMPIKELINEEHTSLADEQKLLDHIYEKYPEILKAKSSLKELQSVLDCKTYFDKSEKEELHDALQEETSIQLTQTIHSRNGSILDFLSPDKLEEELERERERWTESESRWISLTEELRIDLESNRRLAEKKDIELKLEKNCSAELDDALQRAILGHARFIEHYVELQEKHNILVERHRKVMEGIAEVKKAALRAGTKGVGSAFVEALAAELSNLRVEREIERAHLKEQNKGLRIQLRDTAEAVHAAGELLVRLREAEEAVSVTEEKYGRAQQEIEKLRRQMEKLKKKHAMEIVTMKHYLAESRLPESALEPLYRHESGRAEETIASVTDDDQAWRAAFGPSYR